MPLCTLHLLSLSPPPPSPSSPTPSRLEPFLSALRTSHPPLRPLVLARVIRWIILPSTITVPALLEPNWDLLLILPSTQTLPPSLLSLTRAHFSLTAGIPRALTENFAEKNARLLRPREGDVPALTGALREPRIRASAQGLELTAEMLGWAEGFGAGAGAGAAVSMLNLLAFHPGDAARESYGRYGREFGERVGRARGGEAKLVGRVVGGTAGEWEEFALAHYPSALHFADMLAGGDYQAINHEARLPALRDTCILCTCEIDVEGGGEGRAKL